MRKLIQSLLLSTVGACAASSNAPADVPTDVSDGRCQVCCFAPDDLAASVPMRAEYCSQPMVADSGVEEDVVDGSVSDGDTDAAITDPDVPVPPMVNPASCELNCVSACSQARFGQGMPRPWSSWSGQDSCRRIDAMTVECRINIQCGRAPSGLSVERPRPGHEPLSCTAKFLAECALLEAASVSAFQSLAHELRSHSAPQSLIRAAEKSAVDEALHAELTYALGALYNAPQLKYSVQEPLRRTLLEIALENAVEGCVRETWGAVLAAYQWQQAQQHKGNIGEQAEKLLAILARDECAHAALAWRVAQWAEAQLSEHERERVASARQTAVQELMQDLATDPSDELQRELGLPPASVALSLASGLWKTLGVA